MTEVNSKMVSKGWLTARTRPWIRDLRTEDDEKEKFYLLDVPADGNCFFSALCLALDPSYGTTTDFQKRLQKAQNLRSDLANFLQTENESGLQVYFELSSGAFPDYASWDDSFSLEALQNELLSGGHVDIGHFVELTSRFFRINLRVYQGDSAQDFKEDNFSYINLDENWKNVLLCHNGPHFELLASMKAHSTALEFKTTFTNEELLHFNLPSV